MKFNVSSTELLSHLQVIAKVINSKNLVQILDYFLFELQDNTLIMTASDNEIRLTTSIEVQNAEGSGKVAVSNRLILDTLREFSDQPLTFEIDDKTLAMTVKSENGVYNFVGMHGDNYPEMNRIEEECGELKLDADILYRGLSQTVFCAADDELRPMLNGVFVDITKESVTFVATDAHKLAKFKSNYNESSVKDEPIGFILAKKPITLLKSILAKEMGEVEFKFESKRSYFKSENYTMTCVNLEGKYPNYSSIIPQNNPYKVTLDRISFLNGLKRVAVFANQASNLIKLEFNNNSVRISAQDIDFSISAEEFVTCQYIDEPIAIGFKSVFMIEILTSLESNEVVLELADPSRPGLLTPFYAEEEGDDILMLLMPIQLND